MCRGSSINLIRTRSKPVDPVLRTGELVRFLMQTRIQEGTSCLRAVRIRFISKEETHPSTQVFRLTDSRKPKP